MENNVGKTDKIVRIGVGGTLLIVGFLSAKVTGATKWILVAIGIYIALTGIMGWDPIYMATKMSTNKVSDADMKDLLK